jgi:hypothetical protein
MSRYLAVLLLLMLGCSSASAARFRWNAELELGLLAGRGKRLVSTENNYAGISLDGQFNVRYGRWRSWGRVTFDSRYDGSFGNADAEPDLREFALKYSGKDWDFTVGRQAIVWGRADGVNPTNILGVQDTSRLAIWDDERYRGVDVAQLNWRPARGQQVSLLVIPHWRRSRLVATFEEQLAQVPTQRSDAVDTDNPGFALRYEQLGSGFDYSLTTGRFSDYAPYLRFNPDDPSQLQRRFGETWMFGGDFAWNPSSWVFRGEFAYLERESGGLTAPRDEFSAVLGAERELSERLTMNLQFLHSRNDRLADPTLAGPLAPAVELSGQVFRQQRRNYNGAAVNFTLLPSNFLGRLETTVVGFRGGEWLLRVRGEYSLGARGKLEALGEHYRGRSGSTFDGLGDNNGFWVKWSYLFST